jgi:hypothetical protein
MDFDIDENDVLDRIYKVDTSIRFLMIIEGKTRNFINENDAPHSVLSFYSYVKNTLFDLKRDFNFLKGLL